MNRNEINSFSPIIIPDELRLHTTKSYVHHDTIIFTTDGIQWNGSRTAVDESNVLASEYIGWIVSLWAA